MKTVNAIKKLEREGFEVVKANFTEDYTAYKRGHRKITFRSSSEGEAVWIQAGISHYTTIGQAIKGSL